MTAMSKIDSNFFVFIIMFFNWDNSNTFGYIKYQVTFM